MLLPLPVNLPPACSAAPLARDTETVNTREWIRPLDLDRTRRAMLHVSPRPERLRVTATHSRTIGTCALVALLAGTLTGCTAPAAPTMRTTTTATATATISPGPSPNSTPNSSGPSADPAITSSRQTDPGAPDGQCADSVLRVSVQNDPEGSGAGQRAAFVVFRNAGTSTCHLEGTPGLSLVGHSNGTQLGRPAARGTRGGTDVTIAAGGYALAPVSYTYIDKTGGAYRRRARPRPEMPSASS